MKKLDKEYIGLNIKIIESTNQTLIGVKGKIIDETKNTFKIKTETKIKTVLKNSSKFKIGEEIVQGNKITKKPQDRIKMKV